MSTNVSLIMDWLKNTDINLSVISRNTGISRKSLYNWTKGSKPTLKSLEKLTDYYNKVVERESVKLDSTGEMDKDYVNQIMKEKMKLQDEKIESLEENIQLQESIQLSENAFKEEQNLQYAAWVELKYDMITQVQLSMQDNKLARTIISAGQDLSVMERLLGYTEKELRNDYFCEGETYTFSKGHPVDKLISKGSKKRLSKYSVNFPKVFETIKTVVGSHYIPINITYKSKYNTTHTADTFNKVDCFRLLGPKL